MIAVSAGKSLNPLERLKAWMALRGHSAGLLLYQIDPQRRLTDEPMSDRSIARLIQKYAGRVGLDPETEAGHSLRAGFLTEASRNGATIAKMQEVSRHKKVEVLLGYVRPAELLDDYAGTSFLKGMKTINILIYRQIVAKNAIAIRPSFRKLFRFVCLSDPAMSKLDLT